jgi:acetyl esterase/lipase
LSPANPSLHAEIFPCPSRRDLLRVPRWSSLRRRSDIRAVIACNCFGRGRARPGSDAGECCLRQRTSRQKLDFYKAESDKPTPLLFFIHGGGWVAGDKKNPGSLKECLAAGVSVVSINYRYSWQAQIAGVNPPVKAPLEDAARALQFVRSKATEWNIDKQRIGASGGSAGRVQQPLAGNAQRHG